MSEYGEYASVHQVRSLYLKSASATDDALIKALIQQASREIDQVSGRMFYPVIERRYFDAPATDQTLNLNDEFMSITAITNGDATAIDITKVLLLPPNTPSHSRIRLPSTIGTWRASSSGDATSAIAVDGTWGHMHDKTAGWKLMMALTAEVSLSSTSFASAKELFHAGDLAKIDDEIVYIVSVVPPVAPSTTYTNNIDRAVNGATAVGHPISSSVYLWIPGHDIQMLAIIATAAYYSLRSNPVGNPTSIDGVTFETPKDITTYIRNKLSKLGLTKVGFA